MVSPSYLEFLNFDHKNKWGTDLMGRSFINGIFALLIWVFSESPIFFCVECVDSTFKW